jgi:hypothetical protein
MIRVIRTFIGGEFTGKPVGPTLSFPRAVDYLSDMRRKLQHRGILLAVILLATAAAQAKSIARAPAARYDGDRLSLRVDQISPIGDWSGSIVLGESAYPFTAKASDAPDGGMKLAGAFKADGDAFPFTAEQRTAGGEMTLTSGGTTYWLRPAGGAMPAGGVGGAGKLPEELKLKKVEFRDVDMGNVVGCSMLVPEGWTSEGQVKWSQGDVIYPQKIIEVKSPDAMKVLFVPTMNFMYAETDPAWVAQARQLGLPNPPRERDGVAPPEDVGQWLASFVAENNKRVHDVKLVRQERDLPMEESFRKLMGNLSQEESKIFVLGFEYDDDDHPGRRMRDEMVLTFTTQPPLDIHPTKLQSWSVFIQCVYTAPADRFDAVKPLLLAVANSLREAPQWWNAKERTLVAISQIRHQAAMDRIAATGAAIRKAGETYSQMSEDQMASWRRSQASSDESQRKSINAINSTEDYRLPDGGSVKLPGLYENVYKPTTGGDEWYLLTNKTLDSSELQKLEPVK